MPFSDYFGADQAGRPETIRTAPLCGETVDLRPLTAREVFELHGVLCGPTLHNLTLWLFEKRRLPVPEDYQNPAEHDETEGFVALRAAVGILFPRIDPVTLADWYVERHAELDAQVREIVAFYVGAHQWGRITRDLLRITGVENGRITYRKSRGGGSDAAHVSMRLRGGASLFEMLHWRPEAFLSEIAAFEEALSEKKSDGWMTQEEFVAKAFSLPAPKVLPFPGGARG